MATTRAKTSKTTVAPKANITVETRIGMIEYTEVETPAEAVSVIENPHARGIARAKELMADASKSLSIVIATDDKVKHENYLRRGANADGFTMRILAGEVKDAKGAVVEGQTRLTFRAIPRIERKRLTEEEKAAKAAAKAAKVANQSANSNQHQ